MSEIRPWYAVLAAVVLVGVVAGASQLFFRVPQEASDNFNKEFSLVLKDYEDKEVHLYEFRRELLVAYVWASWCTYCADEMKRLAQIKDKYGDKIKIVAVNRAEPYVTAKAFTEPLGLGDRMELLLDSDDSFFKSIGGYAMPETVFIDESGAIVYHQRGPLDAALLEERMKELVE
jgi:thiol-disulfide isomerase/thioredoxin